MRCCIIACLLFCSSFGYAQTGTVTVKKSNIEGQYMSKAVSGHHARAIFMFGDSNRVYLAANHSMSGSVEGSYILNEDQQIIVKFEATSKSYKGIVLQNGKVIRLELQSTDPGPAGIKQVISLLRWEDPSSPSSPAMKFEKW
jgi:hypothetical protein